MGRFTLEYWRDGEWFVGRLVEVPGVISQGASLAALQKNIRDAYGLIVAETQATTPAAERQLVEAREVAPPHPQAVWEKPAIEAPEDLTERAEREWDEQIERDAQAGRLDALIDRALAERENASRRVSPMTKPEAIVHSDPDILGGRPVFVGTRVPLETFMGHLDAGQPLAEFLEDFPSVTRDQLVAALQGAEPPRYALGFFFEWGGGVLWCRNEAARRRFDVGPIEESLPLRPETLARLAEMTTWHDTALNWDYPPDPGPWSTEEELRFERAALEVLATIRKELGPDFEVIDQRHPG